MIRKVVVVTLILKFGADTYMRIIDSVGVIQSFMP